MSFRPVPLCSASLYQPSHRQSVLYEKRLPYVSFQGEPPRSESATHLPLLSQYSAWLATKAISRPKCTRPTLRIPAHCIKAPHKRRLNTIIENPTDHRGIFLSSDLTHVRIPYEPEGRRIRRSVSVSSRLPPNARRTMEPFTLVPSSAFLHRQVYILLRALSCSAPNAG
ncbi:hypothetical protein HYPSUDRAFT_209055 [Hypholoma sublateritium FD-334 SS-4]|uniref:Uncharacterized protein n=1 Tax=Hypholoma sublateritium (strain FD-334 SS-4) TaxID=945553 RepID=A0A0D2N499_HYPSF|nr:hypothetical protein HYPSUDRAFT_209055 [Hypholoma sublateritium FD-334 SS-4]